MSQIFLGLAKKWSFYKVNGANGRILYRVSVHGWAQVSSQEAPVEECVMPDLKALICVKLRETNKECGNFLKMCCALLKNGVFDENH